MLQVREADLAAVQAHFAAAGLAAHAHVLGRAARGDTVRIRSGDRVVYANAHRAAPRLGRDQLPHAVAARQPRLRARGVRRAARRRRSRPDGAAHLRPGRATSSAPYIATGARPRVAILREQGVNGQVEMAAAFDRAGFDAVDVHMSDMLAGALDLARFSGLAACGGFSYGDVLGAGGGWAKIDPVQRARARRSSSASSRAATRFALGVCNGCQMMSDSARHHPGRAHWPRFVRNASEQFEARLALVRVESSPSILLRGMEGSRLPIVVAHGEGRAEFAAPARSPGSSGAGPRGAALRRQPRQSRASAIPANPNGSPRRDHRPDHHGRPRHDHDAAPGARVPHACSTPGARRAGARTAPGCGCSAMRAPGWAEAGICCGRLHL